MILSGNLYMFWIGQNLCFGFLSNSVKKPSAMLETMACSLGWEDPLKKGTATHFSIPAWRIPWTEEPGRLQSMRLKRVEHNWVTFTSHHFTSWDGHVAQAWPIRTPYRNSWQVIDALKVIWPRTDYSMFSLRRGTKKCLDESGRGEWKSWPKAQHSENEDHGIRSHHFMANRWGNSVRLYFWGLQNHCRWWLKPWN